jgi:hypothetical protein
MYVRHTAIKQYTHKFSLVPFFVFPFSIFLRLCIYFLLVPVFLPSLILLLVCSFPSHFLNFITITITGPLVCSHSELILIYESYRQSVGLLGGGISPP